MLMNLVVQLRYGASAQIWGSIPSNMWVQRLKVEERQDGREERSQQDMQDTPENIYIDHRKVFLLVNKVHGTLTGFFKL